MNKVTAENINKLAEYAHNWDGNPPPNANNTIIEMAHSIADSYQKSIEKYIELTTSEDIKIVGLYVVK